MCWAAWSEPPDPGRSRAGVSEADAEEGFRARQTELEPSRKVTGVEVELRTERGITNTHREAGFPAVLDIPVNVGEPAVEVAQAPRGSSYRAPSPTNAVKYAPQIQGYCRERAGSRNVLPLLGSIDLRLGFRLQKVHGKAGADLEAVVVEDLVGVGDPEHPPVDFTRYEGGDRESLVAEIDRAG